MRRLTAAVSMGFAALCIGAVTAVAAPAATVEPPATEPAVVATPDSEAPDTAAPADPAAPVLTPDPSAPPDAAAAPDPLLDPLPPTGGTGVDPTAPGTPDAAVTPAPGVSVPVNVPLAVPLGPDQLPDVPAAARTIAATAPHDDAPAASADVPGTPAATPATGRTAPAVTPAADPVPATSAPATRGPVDTGAPAAATPTTNLSLVPDMVPTQATARPAREAAPVLRVPDTRLEQASADIGGFTPTVASAGGDRSQSLLEVLAGYVFPGASMNGQGALLLLFPLALLLAALTPRIPRLHLSSIVAERGAGRPGFHAVALRPG